MRDVVVLDAASSLSRCVVSLRPALCGAASRAQESDAASSPELRSDPRYLRPRRARLLSRAEERARAARRLRQPRWPARGGQAAARRAAGVLAERLQRARAADGHRSLSDSGPVARLSAEEHPSDSRRVRAAAASGGRPDADARSDRADRLAGVPTIRASTSRSAAARSAAAGCAAKPFAGAQARGAAHRSRQRVRHPGAVHPHRLARRTRWRSARFSRGARRSSPPHTPTRRRRAFASRSPIERAVLAFVQPEAPDDREGVPREEHVQVAYSPFDWTLNDLTGRGGR